MMLVWRLMVACLMVAAAVAKAEEKSWSTLELGIGGYVTSFGSDLRLDTDLGVRGTELDLEDRLDLEDNLTELRIDLRYRFLPRHRLDLAYYDISRDGESFTNEVLRIGEREFDVGIALQTDLEFKVYKFAYAWSFVHDEVTDIAISLGLHAMDVEFNATGQVLGALDIETESADQVFPLPVVGLHASRRVGKRVTLNLDGEYFGIKINDIDGSLVDLRASVDWQAASNLAVFVGYNWVDFDVDSENDDLPGRVEYQYSALVAGVKLLL